MERNTVLYKLRRKCQVLAHNFFSDEMMSKVYFRIVMKERLNLKNPTTFNEKLQWLKLYDYPVNDNVIKCADKYRVREYVKQKGYENILVPLIGVWKKTEEINWDELPNQFVLKCNHGCAYNLICTNKNEFNKEKALKQLDKWLKEDFGAFNIEIHYSKIKEHLILCEEYLGEKITDYKFFCFNGKPEFVYVSNDLIHDRQAKIGFFYIDGTKMELYRDDYEDYKNVKFPDCFSEMIEISKVLSKDFPFVRVDFFWANERYYFAELTFTPSGCMMPFNPKKYDRIYGEQIKLNL